MTTENLSFADKPNIRATALLITGTFLFLVLLFYYPFIYLNFVFNFGNLPPQNIPYFLDSQVWPWSWFYLSSRYGVLWWVLFTDAGMLLVLLVPFIALYLEERRENTYLKSVIASAPVTTTNGTSRPKKMIVATVFRWAVLFITGVGMVIQLLKGAYFILGALTCDQVQQCRLFSLAKGQSSIVPNGSYWWLCVAQVIFFVVLLTVFSIFLAPPSEQLVTEKSKGE